MKQLIVDQIEITRNGTIQVRIHKISSDGDVLGNHRTAIEPGGDIDAQFALVNAHLATFAFAPVSVADVDRIKAQAAAAWTPEVLSAFNTAK